MPDPKEGETREEFVERCIPIVLDDGTAEDQKQAVAVCNSMWEDAQEEGGEKGLLEGLKFVGSPRNPYGTHSSKGYPGGRAGWKKAWRVYLSNVRSQGPIQGTVRRVSMIAAGMKPVCRIPEMSAEELGARPGGDDLKGKVYEKPSDYGLRAFKDPSDDGLTREDVGLSCQDLTDIKRICLQEIAWRQRERERQGKANPLKAVRQTDDELVVANYLILYGGRDLEGIASPRVNADGTKGEYFTADTALESSYTKTGRLYVDWEHGADPDQHEEDEAAKAPGRDDVLGYVDWSTAKADDKGVWVERVLSRHSAYMRYLEQLIDEGVIGNSSEAIPTGVEVKANGEITRWPLKRDTLTVTPMEPRMLTENAVMALKGLAAEFPNVKALADTVASLEAAPEAGSDKEPAASATVGPVTVNVYVEGGDRTESQGDTPPEQKAKERPTSTEDTTMEEKEKTQEATTQAPTIPVADLEDVIGAAITKAIEAVNDQWEKRLAQEGPTNSAGVLVTGDRADRALEGNPFEGMGDFLMAVKQAAHNVWDERLRPLASGDPADEGGFNMTKALGGAFIGSLTQAKFGQKGRKAITGLGEAIDSRGGFLVGTDEAAGIMARVYAVGQLLQRVDMVGISANSNGMTFNVEDETSRADGSRRGGIRGYWMAEQGTFTASYPKFRQMHLRLKKVGALVYATDELLADSSALESYIMQNLPEELRFTVEDAILNGTGSGTPLGILNSGAVVSVSKETGQTATTLVAENVIKMWARRWTGASDYIWLHHQDVLPQLMTMALSVGTGGQLVYMPPGGLSGAPYGTLLGRPAFECEYCQTLGTTGDIYLISPSQFQMIEKGGIETASSIHVNFTSGEQVFRFMYRCDGEPKWDSALTPKNGSNTVSPYVKLDAR